MRPLAARLGRTAAGLVGLAAFQPLLCATPWTFKVACGLFLLEPYALVILSGGGLLLAAVGWGRWAISKDADGQRLGRNLMRCGPILIAAGFALFFGGYLAVNLGVLPLFGTP